MCKYAEDNEEDDECRDPGPELVGVDNLVPKNADEKGQDGNDDDTGKAWNIMIHGVDKLSTDNRVYTGPADTGKDVEKGN